MNCVLVKIYKNKAKKCSNKQCASMDINILLFIHTFSNKTKLIHIQFDFSIIRFFQITVKLGLA